jgi:hypothetical protein
MDAAFAGPHSLITAETMRSDDYPPGIKKEPAPPQGKIGFGYMLQGETATSNVDPFAPPPADGKWHEAGPHVMIFNAKGAMAGYPRPGEKPDTTQPFVMWAGSPYEHLMIPVPAE